MEAQPQHQLNVIFLPLPAPGHMNPMVDTARLFAKHGVSVTVITTPVNALAFQKAIDTDFNSGYHITTRVVPFPSAQAGLPDGLENAKDATGGEMITKVMLGISIVKDQIEHLFQELQPDCLVTDMLYPWTVESAAKLGIPRLHYYSSSYFSTCATNSIRKYKPHERLASDTQMFTIPGLPQSIGMTPLQLPPWLRAESFDTELFEAVYDSESRSYGALYNNFHDLEDDYEQLYKSTVGKSWSVGPVSAWVNKDDERKTDRGGHTEDLAQEPEWLNWLNSKQNESVLYVSFGSLVRLHHSELVELAHGLEHSGHSFIWVIRKDNKSEKGDNFLEEFEVKMKESKQGYIIWNWAPQLLILDNPAIGGFLSHCGWNSILESVSAGLPMITWPIIVDQFFNEKLVVEVLKIGVPVGAKENKRESSEEGAGVGREEIAKVVVHLMGKEESREMRSRARKLSDAAKKSIEEGGSSYLNLMQVLDELKSLKITRANQKPN